MMIRRPEQEEEGVATGAERGGNGDLSKKRKGWQPEKEDEETAGRAILLAPSAVRGAGTIGRRGRRPEQSEEGPASGAVREGGGKAF